jgi:hypothetical protein
MRELVLLLLTLASTQAALASKDIKDNRKLKLTPPGQKAQTTEDPGSATRLLYEDPRNKYSLTADADKKTPDSAIKPTCTDSMGMIHKKGDAGYDGCLRTLNSQAPKLPGDDKRPSSLGITIGQ